MSPEQARALEIDHRTDIWSLGVVLYEAMTGHTPHKFTQISQLLISICSEEPLPIQQFKPDLPDEVAALVHRALQRDPARRFQSAAEMLAAVRAVVGGIDIEAPALPDLGTHAQARPAPPPAGASGPGLNGATDSSKELAPTISAGTYERVVSSDVGQSEFDKYHLIALLGHGGM